MTSSAIVQKLWNYCNVLRDDGMSYLLARGARRLSFGWVSSEQLTYLLFLDERTKPFVPAFASVASPYPSSKYILYAIIH